MWIQVRSDNLKTERVDGLSKMTKIGTLKKLLVDLFEAPVERQRLFFQGKQLEDEHTLFDYNVGLNNVVQILIKPVIAQDTVSKGKNKENLEANAQNSSSVSKDFEPANSPSSKGTASHQEEKSLQSKFFKVGDMVNAKDPGNGAWFEAKIVEIRKKEIKNCSQKLSSESPHDSLMYLVEYANYDNERELLPLEKIRPKFRKLNFDDVKVDDVVLANYNADEPGEIGYWYKCKITDKKATRCRKELIGTVFLGSDEIAVSHCKVKFPDEVYLMTENFPLSEKQLQNHDVDGDSFRQIQPSCSHCKDVPGKKCKHCSCYECGGKDEPEKQLMCDECDRAFHIGCLDPPLTQIPEVDEWYCPLCKNDENEIVKAGEKLKKSKKKAKMASASGKSKRDWGKGMATVGRTKVCTIVPSNHFGAIPGVEVGMAWRYRMQASESGVHRPHVAGIHGRDHEGAFSIVLAGGYEDDLDNGDEFYYTGSGGRDLSGNKRTAVQSCDQTLTLMNKALALNCAAKLNQDGAEAEDWRNGKPVRVLRSAKGRKHSEYCPKVGVRYDGLYKVVKYWKEVGKSGFAVWRFLLRRDDPTLAPYTEAGKKRIKELGFSVQYPDGYSGPKEECDESDEEKPNKRGKRHFKNSAEESGCSSRKRKKSIFTLPSEIEELIAQDERNNKLWEQCKNRVSDGNSEFLKEVEIQFCCICCQDMLVDPVTTECNHNICKCCLIRSFKAEVFTCPMCRHELNPKSDMSVNSFLREVLLKLFPGYSKGR